MEAEILTKRSDLGSSEKDFVGHFRVLLSCPNSLLGLYLHFADFADLSSEFIS
jgi:hypothetical protein